MSDDEKIIKIFIFDDSDAIKVNINRSTKVQEVCELLANHLGLSIYVDFRLFIEDSKKNIRLLDDDEIIFKLIE